MFWMVLEITSKIITNITLLLFVRTNFSHKFIPSRAEARMVWEKQVDTDALSPYTADHKPWQ